jgi:hypothetical protein
MLVRCKKQQPPLHNYTCPQLFAWFMIDPEDYFCFCAHFHCHPFAYPVRFQLRHGTCQCHHSGTSKSPLKRSFVEQRFRSPRPHGTSLRRFCTFHWQHTPPRDSQRIHTTRSREHIAQHAIVVDVSLFALQLYSLLPPCHHPHNHSLSFSFSKTFN